IYEVHEHAIPSDARLYLFSDGVYEAELESGELLGLDGLVQLLRTPGRETSQTQFIYDVVCRQHGSRELVDDFSLVEFRFHD
ncbi:MAG TPA: SpoIIE family protein phosphatase, partial [Pirellulaceae bacterium]|nr:SpoIIE family protein phosphatase [Pirellulaceae bacterium]